LRRILVGICCSSITRSISSSASEIMLDPDILGTIRRPGDAARRPRFHNQGTSKLITVTVPHHQQVF
jgi:hypothetical protein